MINFCSQDIIKFRVTAGRVRRISIAKKMNELTEEFLQKIAELEQFLLDNGPCYVRDIKKHFGISTSKAIHLIDNATFYIPIAEEHTKSHSKYFII